LTGGSDDGEPDDDAWNMLWDGTHVDARLGFGGRSGGWLVLTWFQGHLMDADCDLSEWDYKTLRQLSEYVTWAKHCIKKPEDEVEYLAASTFFCNICHKIQTTEERNQEWSDRDQSGEH
jgi:hypothetical protein